MVPCLYPYSNAFKLKVLLKFDVLSKRDSHVDVYCKGIYGAFRYGRADVLSPWANALQLGVRDN